ncbi:MAG TPA: hypothetical protein VNK49_00845 [Anaerolineales bacterium]|nr:hypothetical protein [Anaerolineales bacterium]
MTSPRPKYEGWLYGLAFLVALGLRLIQLGAKPLTDSEASFALQAYQIAQGKTPLLAPQPAYILFTGFFFAVIEATNFLARFVPSIVGSTLVFAPWFFREQLKPRPALILAFLLAFDPGFVALSRQAGGTILAVTFLFFAWAMWKERHFIPAGIFAGLALLSGPSIWSGLLVLSLSRIFARGTNTAPSSNSLRSNSPTSNPQPSSDPKPSTSATSPLLPLQSFLPLNSQLRATLLAFLSTLLLCGTLFFIVPNGLSAAFSSLPAYLNGWVLPSAFTPGLVLWTFIAYEPLGIFLALLGLYRGMRLKSARIIRLSIWLGVALLLAVFYRQPAELAWAIIPLLILSAQELSRALETFPEERLEIGIIAGAILILLTYIWFNLSNIALNPYDTTSTPIQLFGRAYQLPISVRYVILIGALLILGLSIALVALGWSTRTARLGTTWALSIFLGIYTFAAAWGASGVRTQNGMELWSADQPPVQADLLLSTVQDLSLLSLGHARSQPVTITGINSPALEWLLRDHNVNVVTALDPQNMPPIIITPLMNDLGLPAAYRGQDFIWRQSVVWNGIQNPEWIRWLVFRQLPLGNETIILWARDDLFPDARENIQP